MTRVWSIRIVIIVCALIFIIYLIKGWRAQLGAPLQCQAHFGKLAEHNGYIQISLLGPQALEPYFNGEVFLYYASHESPPNALSIVREAETYPPEMLEVQLAPWGDRRLAIPRPVRLSIPTFGITPKLFPFDSLTFDFSLQFTPPRMPKVVLIRNLTTDFIPRCDTFESKWDGVHKLSIHLSIQRNPFVQATVVIISLAALGFGMLLGFVKKTEDLAVATASYFFSIWSVRAIVAPSGLPYPTLLDLWLMMVCVIVLLILAWRLSVGPTKG